MWVAFSWRTNTKFKVLCIIIIVCDISDLQISSSRIFSPVLSVRLAKKANRGDQKCFRALWTGQLTIASFNPSGYVFILIYLSFIIYYTNQLALQ